MFFLYTDTLEGPYDIAWENASVYVHQRAADVAAEARLQSSLQSRLTSKQPDVSANGVYMEAFKRVPEPRPCGHPSAI